MKLESLLQLFVPKDHTFFPLFEQGAQNVVKASVLLKELMVYNQTEDHERVNKEIKDLEHIGDEITGQIYEQLNTSFITPFDREDIQELTSHLDDVIDSINGISRRMCLYQPKNILPVYTGLAEMIHEAAREVEIAVRCLNDPSKYKDQISAACDKVSEIEHRADEMYFAGVMELFEKETNSKELLKNNKILELLERCIDEQEDITDTIKTIIIKMA
jgi:predicted phosphate transport protein (TIGR00153 family)